MFSILYIGFNFVFGAKRIFHAICGGYQAFCGLDRAGRYFIGSVNSFTALLERTLFYHCALAASPILLDK